MPYTLLKLFVGFCFNVLNVLLLGNLPPLASVCVMIEQEGKLLVVTQPGGESAFPGGFVRWREKVEQAAVRECLEETGLHVRLGNVIAHDSEFSPRFTKISTLTIIYEAEIIDGEMRGSIEGQPRWISEEELRASLIRHQNPIYGHYVDYRARRNEVKLGSLPEVSPGIMSDNL